MNRYLLNWIHHPSGKQGTTEHECESYVALCMKMAEWNRANPSAWAYWFCPGIDGLGAAKPVEQPFAKRIQDALGTAETDEALVEVARAAHKAEQELAALKSEGEAEREV